jgi:hypothetical protein
MLAAEVENVVLRSMLAGADRAEAARRAGVSPRELAAILEAGEHDANSPAGTFLAGVTAIERGAAVELPPVRFRDLVRATSQGAA